MWKDNWKQHWNESDVGTIWLVPWSSHYKENYKIRKKKNPSTSNYKSYSNNQKTENLNKKLKNKMEIIELKNTVTEIKKLATWAQ